MKKSSPSKKYSKNKKYIKKSGKGKKLWIALGVLAAAAVLTLILVLTLGSSDPVVDNWEQAEANLKEHGYEIGSYVPELNGYSGFVRSMSATYTESNSNSLADYINAEKEVVNFVQFDSEENAASAYAVFESKWGEKYDKHGVVGDIVYFGTEDAVEIATTIAVVK